MAGHSKKSSHSATAIITREEKARFVPKSSNVHNKSFDKKETKKLSKTSMRQGEKKTGEVEKAKKSCGSDLKKDKVNLHRLSKWVKFEKSILRSFQSGFKKKLLVAKENVISEVYRILFGLRYIKNAPNFPEILLKTKIFGTMILMILTLFLITRMPPAYKKAYAVVLNNQVVGYVKDKSEAQNLLDRIAKEVQQKHKTNSFILQNQLQLKAIEPGEYRETSIDILKNAILEKGKVLVKRYALFVDSKPYFVFEDSSLPGRILERLKSLYYGSKAGQAKFKEKVEIKPVYVSPDMKVADEESAFTRIMFGKDQVMEYTIKEGDTLWELARKYNLSVDDIFASNPGLSEKIMPGQKIRLTKATPLINVMLEKEIEYEDVLPKEVKIVKSDRYYTTQSIVKQEGRDGRAKIRARIVYMNGLEYDREILSQQIIQKPVERIVVQGTKKPPAYFATGRFSYPVWGTLTSRFGYRGREFHNGIDLAVPWGSNVYAADGGVVEFAGWSGSYGKLIVINHQNGYQTYYGHLSSILVAPGQKVAKGQLIAKSGSTGRSTGPHLHFEVRKYGVPQNPLRYLQ
ncbi:peptidoglycan DD-metalloendopeptidase family protein [Caldicellulosiruptor morganii]|uniref:Peptidoglycan DD-metalloendopeptidase family protein n=1 Tax=Caldicellulosiruptor morganii TaxID=1387555 RepID=A0ABY7BQP9_9FIRM|nr:peptidoglycan DD-metalloendopeptidase family protein [Caldicellulosiruptor morganii]WAM33759.1 peptidoglycan DD-metalloendopeptidase family protein [Caldicellulosiruptor morganii]